MFYFSLLDENNQRWFIPINIATSNGVNHKTLMSDPDMIIFMGKVTADGWIKINPGQVGFYRTCYSPEMITRLVPGIQSLSPVDRLGIENDLFALSVAGVSRTVDFLNILTGYKNETNYTVWSDIDSNISSLGVIIQNTNFYESFKDFVIRLYKPVFEKLGWNPRADDGMFIRLIKDCMLYKCDKKKQLKSPCRVHKGVILNRAPTHSHPLPPSPTYLQLTAIYFHSS